MVIVLKYVNKLFWGSYSIIFYLFIIKRVKVFLKWKMVLILLV